MPNWKWQRLRQAFNESGITYLSATSTTIASAVALAFLAVEISILASVTKLAAHPSMTALLTLFAKAASIIDIYAAWTEPEALRKARRILDDHAA
jgi:hypothetical protein